LWQQLTRRPKNVPTHVILAVANHFEPGVVERPQQRQLLDWWCSEYRRKLASLTDVDGQPFRHTFFYPAEQYDPEVIQPLVSHCRQGWGEIEIHLHHGIDRPDTSENTRRILSTFRDALAAHGCLSRWDGNGSPRYAFVHGNWALANARADSKFCGVDDEMQILSETGCYADFSLPSAPSPAQISKINALYECGLALHTRAPHRRGRDLQRGRPPSNFPLIIQGPLSLRFSGLALPRIENSELSGLNPPTLDRFRLWMRAAITVKGRADWVFIKLHCHGLDLRDESAMFGSAIQSFLHDLMALARNTEMYRPHFVTTREMTNIVLAACDGHQGNPADYRDYRLRLIEGA
jgi:hypothetical protein